MKRLALVLIVLTAAFGFALRPALASSTTMWLVLFGAYFALAGVAVHKMWDEGTLADWLTPRWGDLSIGAVVTAALLIASWFGRSLLAPVDTERQSWLLRIYLQVGNDEAIQASVLLTALLLLLPVLEELVWRYLVLTSLAERFGWRAAWPATAALNALVLAPTAFTLADPDAGPNPLLILAALGCGLIWSFLAARLRRLPPVIISHVAFTYFAVTQFRLPGF